MNLLNNVKILVVVATLGFASTFVVVSYAQADDPVLLRQLDQVTDQNLQSEDAQIQAAKTHNSVKKR